MKGYKSELIVNLLRKMEVGIANGKIATQACKERKFLNTPTTAGEGNPTD